MDDNVRYVCIGVAVGIVLALVLPLKIIGLSMALFILTNPHLYRPTRH